MNQNIIKRMFILTSFILCILVMFVLYQRILPKEFEEFYILNEQEVVSGSIFYPEVGEVEVDLKDMKQLLDLFNSKKYYYEGRTTDVIEGSLYHINFGTKEKVFYDIIVSNQGYLIIERKQYRISPEQDILEYLSKIMNIGNSS